MGTPVRFIFWFQIRLLVHRSANTFGIKVPVYDGDAGRGRNEREINVGGLVQMRWGWRRGEEMSGDARNGPGGDRRWEKRGGEWRGGGWEGSEDAGWGQTRSYVNRALHALLLHVCGNTLFEIDSCASLLEFSC